MTSILLRICQPVRALSISLIPNLLIGISPATAASPVLIWQTAISSAAADRATGISIDGSGGVYVSGVTFGSIGGINAGSQDAFVVKFDSTFGAQVWARQLGTSSFDDGNGISADGMGNVFVVGNAQGDLGGPYQGSTDAFLGKYDSGGNLSWIKQLGSTGLDWGMGVSTDGSGNALVTGRTTGLLGSVKFGSDDGYLTKFDASGNTAWTNQFGTGGSEWGKRVAQDTLGNVFVAGAAWGLFDASGQQDFFVARFDSSGNQLWVRNLGTAAPDQVNAVSVDGLGNAYVAGITEGQLGSSNFGSSDAFVCKFDASGNLVWTQQIGTTARDSAWAVSADNLGNVYVGGQSATPTIGAITHSDAFVKKLAGGDGSLEWTFTLPGNVYSDVQGLSVGASGSIYVTGNSAFSIPTYDAYVLKIVEIPEPASGTFLGITAFMLLAPNYRRKSIPHNHV